MSKTTQLILTDEQLNIAVQDIATQLEMAVEWLRGEVEILRDALVHIRSIDTMEFGAVATKLLNALEREMQGETKGGHAVTTLTNADLAAIRERYKQCVHESDYADLAEHIPALLDTIAEMRGVIAAIVHDTAGWDIHGGDDYFVSTDLLRRARAVLARMEREE